jgi:hypothetical protein
MGEAGQRQQISGTHPVGQQQGARAEHGGLHDRTAVEQGG